MSSVFSENLKIYNAEQFKLSVSENGPSDIYFTFGKVTGWANDAAPTQANTSISTFNDIWDNMIGAKKITGNDIRHAIPRNNWETGTVYTEYDHDVDSLELFSANVKFFVVSTDWNVYKCLSNNNGAISTVMPQHISTNSPIEEADGYIWKFMYTISHEERLRFTTTEYVPVKTLVADDNSLQWQVQDQAISGSINAVKVVSFGNNYTNANTITVSITGNGTGANAVARVNTTSNTISTIVITNPGSSYTFATVTITDSASGSNASARAIISPPGGHGSDALRELGGSYIIMNPRLVNSEGDVLPVENEYRQLEILQDPLVRTTSNVAANLVYTQLTSLTLSTGSSNYLKDEIVYQGASLATSSFKATVATWDATNNIIRLTNTLGTTISDVLVGANSGAIRYVTTITQNGLLPYSGKLLYTNNISPIQRAIDQTDDFKIVIKF